jgi:MoxR-like ATPase
VKLQRLMAASALLCGRLEVNTADLWVLRYIWDGEDQQEVLGSIVQDAIDKCAASQAAIHPRSRGGDAPDAESLARDLRRIADRLAKGPLPATERSYLKDRLGLLAARCPWVEDSQQRAFLEQQLGALWQQLETAA